jgi:hypothetical protein
MNAMNDPRATLSLFQPIDPDQEERSLVGSPVVSPRTAAKPVARDLAEILSGTETQLPDQRSASPTKRLNGGFHRAGASKNYGPIRLFDGEEAENETAPKSPEKKTHQRAGAAKNYGPIRLFEDDDEESFKSPEKAPGIKTDSKKYSHFEFGEPDMPPPPKPNAIKKKHASQWDFVDFVTPEKPKPKVRTQEARHFGWSDDEEKSPVQRPIVHQPRPDAETHFEFVDDGTPSQTKKPHHTQKGRQHNDGLGLYKDNVIGDEGDESAEKRKKPLATISGPNVDLGHRHKDFDPQYEFADDSPSVAGAADENVASKKLDDNKAKVLKGLNASWGLYDESPEQTSKKENSQPAGYKTAGNGMGGRKDSQRHWGFGDNNDNVQPEQSKAEKLAAAAAASSNASSKRKGEEVKSLWDF